MTATQETRGRGRPRTFDRADVLSKALALFSREGFNQTSVSDLCAAMSLNPSSLYSTFGSKAQLFIETLDRYEQVYWDPLLERFHEEEDVQRAFLRLFDAVAEMMVAEEKRQGWMAALSAVTIAPNAPEVVEAISDFRARSIAHFQQRLARGVSSGQVREVENLEVVANALHAILDGMAVRAKEGLGVDELKAIGRLGTDLIPQTWESSRWGTYRDL